jgi:hypothetical protein
MAFLLTLLYKLCLHALHHVSCFQKALSRQLIYNSQFIIINFVFIEIFTLLGDMQRQKNRLPLRRYYNDYETYIFIYFIVIVVYKACSAESGFD